MPSNAAAAADVSIVIVGTNDDWESEGWDRAELELPGRQDELISRVADVCPRTVVVVNAGSPVAMPWLESVAAVLMAWFPGQEMGASLVDVLCGDVEPQGRLPVTFPRRLEDTPAFEHHPGRNGVAATRAMTLAADALLLGRITYEGMAQAWPTRGGNPFADHVNSITKYVVASQPVDDQRRNGQNPDRST